VGVSQSFNLSGQGEARGEAVRVEEAALEAEARAVLLERRLSVAEAWLALWAAEQAVEQSTQEVTLAESFRKAVDSAAALGASTKLEQSEASAYLAEARLALLDAEGLVAERRVVLARLLGQEPSRPPRATGPLPEVELPASESYASVVVRAEQLPDAEARSLGAKAERARAEELRTQRDTWLNLGVSGTREYDGAYGGALTVSLVPPLFDRGERERGTVLANAARLEGEARDATHRATGELLLAFHEVEHSREVLDTVQQQLLPSAEEAARLRELLFQSGDSTVPEVVLARRALASARIRLGLARAEEARARVKARFLLDALSGVHTP